MMTRSYILAVGCSGLFHPFCNLHAHEGIDGGLLLCVLDAGGGRLVYLIIWWAKCPLLLLSEICYDYTCQNTLVMSMNRLW